MSANPPAQSHGRRRPLHRFARARHHHGYRGHRSERDGHLYRFVDTAGIRRKGKTNLVAEKLSVVMARRGLERADVALLIVDGEQGVTQGDAQIASYAEESGRSVIIVMNKWDLAAEAARKAAERDAATTKGKAKLAARQTQRPRAGARISARTIAKAKVASEGSGPRAISRPSPLRRRRWNHRGCYVGCRHRASTPSTNWTRAGCFLITKNGARQTEIPELRAHRISLR